MSHQHSITRANIITIVINKCLGFFIILRQAAAGLRKNFAPDTIGRKARLPKLERGRLSRLYLHVH